MKTEPYSSLLFSWFLAPPPRIQKVLKSIGVIFKGKFFKIAWQVKRTMEEQNLIAAAIAASVAGGCIKCLEYHKKHALKAGFTEEDILEIATLAFKIRDRADILNRADLDTILTGNAQGNMQGKTPSSTGNSSCCG